MVDQDDVDRFAGVLDVDDRIGLPIDALVTLFWSNITSSFRARLPEGIEVKALQVVWQRRSRLPSV
jgi:hypothetical protein